jgi:ActR/RegA family two-component response regulator
VGILYLTQTTSSDLRVLICDDEFLLAMDMAEQFEALQAEVVSVVGRLSELEQLTSNADFPANAVVLDWQFMDGKADKIIPLLEQRGAAIVVCSGYAREERPPELSHIPWLTKPANADEIAQALLVELDGRGLRQSD